VTVLRSTCIRVGMDEVQSQWLPLCLKGASLAVNYNLRFIVAAWFFRDDLIFNAR